MDAFFLPGQQGQLLCVERRPAAGAEPRGILLLPPFAEEMNKSRRMLARFGDAAARAGFVNLLPDLYGTGDSEGEFSDADVDIWLDDLGRAAQRLLDNGAQRLTLLGLRTGCLLATHLSDRFEAVDSLLFWQPVSKGAAYLNQFLRLRIAAGMTGDGERVTTKQLREALRAGQGQEVAGYAISPQLAAGMDTLALDSWQPARPLSVLWCEMVADQERPLLPASVATIAALAAGGATVDEATVVGPAFWSTQEIAESSALIARSVAWLAGLGR